MDGEAFGGHKEHEMNIHAINAAIDEQLAVGQAEDGQMAHYRTLSMDELTLHWGHAMEIEDWSTTDKLEAVRAELAQEVANLGITDEEVAIEREKAAALNLPIPESDIDIKLSIYRHRQSQ